MSIGSSEKLLEGATLFLGESYDSLSVIVILSSTTTTSEPSTEICLQNCLL